MKLKHAWLICILFLIPVMAFSLEVKEGKIKLLLHEKSGRFSAYYLQDVKQNRYVPLFLDQDPRTTSLSILEGNKVYRMGEASGFQQTAEKTADGARFVWKSAAFTVTEDFGFVRSESSPLANGFSITVSIRNTSEQDLYLGVRYIVDTYLGEDANVHFRTDTFNDITNEKSFASFSLPSYIVSTDGSSDGLGFMIMARDGGGTIPDEAVIANWKRLNDASWAYAANESRNFNQLPYSINDSAVAMFYSATRAAKGEEKKVVLVMGAYSKEGYNVASAASSSPIANMFQNAIINESRSGEDMESAVKTDLITITDLLNRIDEKLTAGTVPTDEELKIFRQVVEELDKRKSQYDSP